MVRVARPVRLDRRVAIAVLAASGLGLAVPPAAREVQAKVAVRAPAAPAASVTALAPAACPPATLPDGEGPEAACVRLPAHDEGDDALADAESVTNSHRDREGRWVVYDQIPRRPDRSAAYDAYAYPIPCDHDCVVSGYDLDRPDELQRRGRRLREVGHGALDLTAARGTPVTALDLAHQEGPTEVLFAGSLFGNSVVTLHSLREGRSRRDYLVILGHLDGFSAAAVPGARVRPGDVLGFVGDSGSPGLVHLHLEVRRVRSEVATRRDLVRLASTTPSALVAGASIVCDPRNVLPPR